jgi:galactokinase
MTSHYHVTLAFETLFYSEPSFLVRAPGRLNLIGEHTDYNDGFVLPVAIDRAVWIALRPCLDRRVVVRSLDFDETVEFPLDDMQHGKGWAEYLRGVAWALQDEGFKLTGWEGVIAGDVPIGAGLSSSAATEMAAARAFAAVSGLDWEPVRMARVGQKAENQWVGVNCGIMDQMVSAVACAGHALFLDCRTLEYEHVPLPVGIALAVLDTSTRRGLVASVYNERRARCAAAARHFGVQALRDISLQSLEEKGRGLDEITFHRARHVVTENGRVLEAVKAMQAGDVLRLGRLLNESHASLRDDFEVTNPALNQMVECALKQSGCYGARMTGAGFGGCALAIVHADAAQAFAGSVVECYRMVSGLNPSIHICTASEGTGLVMP